MAHFAKIGLNSKVMETVVVHNNELLDADGVEQEVNGIDFLTKLTGWSIWKQTSYNTYGGEHKLGGTPFRKNYAGIGYTYDHARDAFIPPKPYDSWILNPNTCQWDAPIEYPSDGKSYTWDDENQQWEEINHGTN